MRRRPRAWLLVPAVALLGLPMQRGFAGEAHGERKFEITASRYKYEPARIEVEEGDRVHLVVRSVDTSHGLSIPALKAKAEIPKGGASVDLIFLANRVGRFRFECTEYCGTGHKAMIGELVVTARSR